MFCSSLPSWKGRARKESGLAKKQEKEKILLLLFLLP